MAELSDFQKTGVFCQALNIIRIPLFSDMFCNLAEGVMGGAVVCWDGSLLGRMVWARVVPCPFWWWGLFGDEAVGEEAEVLVVADDEVIEEVDVEDVAGLDEFGGYLFVGSAGFGVAGWVVVDDHDGVCVGEEVASDRCKWHNCITKLLQFNFCLFTLLLLILSGR